MFEKTRSVLNKIFKDITKLKIICDIILQVILFGLCVFNVISNIHNVIKLIIYICMLICSIFWLIYLINFYLGKLTSAYQKAKKKNIQHIVKYLRLGYRFVLVILACVDIFSGALSGFALFVPIFTVSSYILKIIITVISELIAYYISLLSLAIEEDLKPITNTIDNIKHPLYGISKALSKDKNEDRVVDAKTQDKLDIINSLADEWKINVEKKKQERKELRKQFIKKVFGKKTEEE